LAGKTDEDLVVAAINGDVDSFVALCHRYYAALVTVARAVLRDGHLAEDAAQETLAKACRKLDSLNDPRRFGAWLIAICRNEATDMLRRIPRMEDLGDREMAQDAPEENSDVVGAQQAIGLLPADSRELLYLRYRNGLSYEEIATLLATTPEAIHGRLRRAKQAVRAHLERQQDRRLS
jgi:RNA polymerase sigma-70 factor (ECF subfamily)